MGLCLFFLPNFPGAMFIQMGTFIPDSRVTRKRRKLTEPETYLEKRFMSYLLGTQASKRFPFQTNCFLQIGLRKLSIIREFCY